MRLFSSLKRALVLAGAFAFATPAVAGITVVAGTGAGNSLFDVHWNNTTTDSAPTTANLLAGDLAVIIAGQTSTGAATLNCANADGSGTNTWQAAPGFSQNNGAATQIWYSVLTSPVNSGTNLTCSSSVSGNVLIQGLGFRGAAASPYDASGNTTNSGTTATTSATGALSCPAGSGNCEVCVGGTNWHAWGNTTTDAAFTDTSGPHTGIGWANGYKLVTTSTSLTYTGTNATSTNYSGTVACFKAATAASAAPPQSLLGVGP